MNSHHRCTSETTVQPHEPKILILNSNLNGLETRGTYRTETYIMDVRITDVCVTDEQKNELDPTWIAPRVVTCPIRGGLHLGC